MHVNVNYYNNFTRNYYRGGHYRPYYEGQGYQQPWRHDPGHRKSIGYRDTFTASRFAGQQTIRNLGPSSPVYRTNLQPRKENIRFNQTITGPVRQGQHIEGKQGPVREIKPNAPDSQRFERREQSSPGQKSRSITNVQTTREQPAVKRDLKIGEAGQRRDLRSNVGQHIGNQRTGVAIPQVNYQRNNPAPETGGNPRNNTVQQVNNPRSNAGQQVNYPRSNAAQQAIGSSPAVRNNTVVQTRNIDFGSKRTEVRAQFKEGIAKIKNEISSHVQLNRQDNSSSRDSGRSFKGGEGSRGPFRR